MKIKRNHTMYSTRALAAAFLAAGLAACQTAAGPDAGLRPESRTAYVAYPAGSGWGPSAVVVADLRDGVLAGPRELCTSLNGTSQMRVTALDAAHPTASVHRIPETRIFAAGQPLDPACAAALEAMRAQGQLHRVFVVTQALNDPAAPDGAQGGYVAVSRTGLVNLMAFNPASATEPGLYTFAARAVRIEAIAN